MEIKRIKMLAIQKYLQDHSLEQLEEEYSVKVSRHQNYPNLVCFKYCQISSPMKVRLVQECRGLILDENNNWQVVSYPYDKFFNYDSHLAPQLDWQTTSIYEKLDGSLVILYFYDGNWHVQTSGTADATGIIRSHNISMKDLFWSTWQQLNYQIPSEKDYCFIFELISPINRIIVNYQENDLILHGVRSLKTFVEEHPAHWCQKYNWKCIKDINNYAFSNLEEVLAKTHQMNGFENEGFVAVDSQFRRIKIKSPHYVRIHLLKIGEYTNRRLVEIVVNNEGDEFLNYLPSYKKAYETIYSSYLRLIAAIKDNFDKYKNIESQKEFALQAKQFPYSGILFQLKANKNKAKKIEQYVQQMKLNTLMKLLNVPDIR